MASRDSFAKGPGVWFPTLSSCVREGTSSIGPGASRDGSLLLFQKTPDVDSPGNLEEGTARSGRRSWRSAFRSRVLLRDPRDRNGDVAWFSKSHSRDARDLPRKKTRGETALLALSNAL